jgi:hypothetical protein
MKSLSEFAKETEFQFNKNNPVALNEEALNQISGGAEPSAGRVCSISAECSSSGTSCRDILRDLIDILF